MKNRDILVKVKNLPDNTNDALANKSDSNHTHNYAGSSSAGGAATSANKVNSSLIIQGNGTSLGTFNGSSSKTINITPDNIGAVTQTDYDKFINNNFSCINVKDYGAIGNGTTDDTQALKNSIIKASTLNLQLMSSTWNNCAVIYLPPGSYKITDSIINSDMDISGIRFMFIGESYQNTEIYFETSTEKYLFDNQGIFGRSIFKNISFISNNTGKLLNLVGGGTGNAQSITFSNCLISKFNNIINSTYSGTATMGSEITFENCKLNTFDTNSILFNLGNVQAVNWRFVNTDIELYNGIVFNYIHGQNISIYQGSMVGLDNSIFVNVDSTADDNMFGQANAPHLIMIGSRFELRLYSKLYSCNNANVKFEMHLISCGMGGLNKTSLTDSNGNKSFVMENIGRGHFIFDNCHNWGNYWIHSHKIFNSNGYLENNNAYIEFKNNGPSSQTLSDNMIITEASGGSYYNIGANPTYNFINCRLKALVKMPLNNYLSKNNGYLYSNYPSEVTKKVMTIGCTDNGFSVSGISGTSPSFSKSINLPKGISILSLKLIIEKGWTGGYSSNEFDLSITNKDGSFEFIKDSYVSKDGIVLISDEFYRTKDSDGIKITWTATKNISATYSCIAHLVLEY